MADVLISNEQTKFLPGHVTTVSQPIETSNSVFSECFEKEASFYFFTFYRTLTSLSS